MREKKKVSGAVRIDTILSGKFNDTDVMVLIRTCRNMTPPRIKVNPNDEKGKTSKTVDSHLHGVGSKQTHASMKKNGRYHLGQFANKRDMASMVAEALRDGKVKGRLRTYTNEGDSFGAEVDVSAPKVFYLTERSGKKTPVIASDFRAAGIRHQVRVMLRCYIKVQGGERYLMLQSAFPTVIKGRKNLVKLHRASRRRIAAKKNH